MNVLLPGAISNMVKKILSKPRLIRGKRWKIQFFEYDLETGEEVPRFQEFNLNSIPDPDVREEVAKCLLANLEKFARFTDRKRTGPTVVEAIEQAVAIKKKLPRAGSFVTYRTVKNLLLAWLQKTGYGQLPIKSFTRKHAVEFWDTITDRKLKGRTLNNYLVSVSALWTVLIKREVADKNPFDLIDHVRNGEKTRRPFTDAERVVVATWAKEKDYWMFRGILLQYFCYIRPVELNRLKFRHFNFSEGTVTITEDNAKSYKTRIATIPHSVLHYFIDGRFERYPANYFLFGMPDNRGRGGGVQPAAKPAEKMRMYKRHAKLLKRLKELGELNDIEGLSWYSWKDTGITKRLNNENFLIPTKDQAGHENVNTTMIYRHKDRINETYRDMPNDLF